METKEIKELMLSGGILISETDKSVHLNCENSKGYCLDVISKPDNNYWSVDLYDYCDNLLELTDEQYNMICKYVESEFNEYHSNNSAFTDEDKEHFNSLI